MKCLVYCTHHSLFLVNKVANINFVNYVLRNILHGIGSSIQKHQMLQRLPSFAEKFTYSVIGEAVGEIINKENREQFIDSLTRSEEHTSELQSRQYLVCRLLLEKKKKKVKKLEIQVIAIFPNFTS